MYLSRFQYAKMREALSKDASGVPKEMMDYFIQNGLIEMDLFQYRLTEKGEKVCSESRNEHELQDADNKTGPSGKRDFYRERRTVFTNNDADLVIEKKRKGIESKMHLRPKPDTKYKEIK